MNNEAIHNTDADAVRALLEKWYAGSATAADEQRLIDCFCATPTADIPADLRPDAQIFRAMGSVPAVDAEEADRAVDKAIATAQARRRKRFIRVTRYVAGAAAVAACLALLFRVGTPKELEVNLGGRDSASAPMAMMSPANTESSTPIAVETEEPVEAPAVAAEAPAVPKRAPRANVRMPKPTDYGYREADAEEAARILSHSLDKVDQVVRSGSDRAVADVARHINNATTLLNLSVANVSVSTDNSIRKTELILKTINLLQDENN